MRSGVAPAQGSVLVPRAPPTATTTSALVAGAPAPTAAGVPAYPSHGSSVVVQASPWCGLGNWCRPALTSAAAASAPLCAVPAPPVAALGAAPPLPAQLPSLTNVSVGRSVAMMPGTAFVSASSLPAASAISVPTTAAPSVAVPVAAAQSDGAVFGFRSRSHFGFRRWIMNCARPRGPTVDSPKAAASAAVPLLAPDASSIAVAVPPAAAPAPWPPTATVALDASSIAPHVAVPPAAAPAPWPPTATVALGSSIAPHVAVPPAAASAAAPAPWPPTATVALGASAAALQAPCPPTAIGAEVPAPEGLTSSLAREALQSGPPAGEWPNIDEHKSFMTAKSRSRIFTEEPRRRKPVQATDWWAPADPSAAKNFEDLREIAELLEARILRHPPSAKQSLPGASGALYEEMGAIDPSLRYVAVWLNMDAVSLVSVSESLDDAHLDRCLAGSFLKDRCKFITNPVHVALPFPAKPPRDADTVGNFFSGGASATTRVTTPCGAVVDCIRIDFFSIWLLRMAIKKVGFRPGNTVELYLVDYDNRAVFAGVRLMVTEEFCRLLA